MKTIGVPQPQGGKKVDPWKPNKEVCPEYPYWTHYNEDGEIVYSVPMDVMNDIPVDDDEEEKYSYSFLPILNMRSGCAISAKIRGAVPGKTVVHRRRGSSGAFLGATRH